MLGMLALGCFVAGTEFNLQDNALIPMRLPMYKDFPSVHLYTCTLMSSLEHRDQRADL